MPRRPLTVNSKIDTALSDPYGDADGVQHDPVVAHPAAAAAAAADTENVCALWMDIRRHLFSAILGRHGGA